MTEMVKCKRCGGDMEPNQIGEHYHWVDCFEIANRNLSTVTAERDRAGELIAFFNGRLSEEIMNSERLAEELRLEQNPGYSCEALRMHNALRLSRKQNTEAPHD